MIIPDLFLTIVMLVLVTFVLIIFIIGIICLVRLRNQILSLENRITECEEVIVFMGGKKWKPIYHLYNEPLYFFPGQSNINNDKFTMILFLYGYLYSVYIQLRQLLTQYILAYAIIILCFIILYKTYRLNPWLQIMLIALFALRTLS